MNKRKLTFPKLTHQVQHLKVFIIVVVTYSVPVYRPHLFFSTGEY